MDYDELIAVELINNKLKAEGKTPYDYDEVVNVIDMIWDYYEENGLLDIDAGTEDADDVEPEVIDYVTRMLKKDKEAKVRAEDVPIMVHTEMEYEDTIIGF